LPENFADLGVLGDVNEPLFAKAIEDIIGNRSFKVVPNKLEQVFSSKSSFSQNNMFIDLK
jgi:hypothetical protein